MYEVISVCIYLEKKQSCLLNDLSHTTDDKLRIYLQLLEIKSRKIVANNISVWKYKNRFKPKQYFLYSNYKNSYCNIIIIIEMQRTSVAKPT